jgi:hypothetical protein
MVFFRFYWSHRCLCWDHASSLAFENITQNSSPTPTQTLTWIRLSSRRMYIYQLAVLCSEMLARRSARRRNLAENPSWYILYSRRRLCTQTHFLMYYYFSQWTARPHVRWVNHPERPATNEAHHVWYWNTMGFGTHCPDSWFYAYEGLCCLSTQMKKLRGFEAQLYPSVTIEQDREMGLQFRKSPRWNLIVLPPC